MDCKKRQIRTFNWAAEGKNEEIIYINSLFYYISYYCSVYINAHNFKG